jgi:hypothetical protein
MNGRSAMTLFTFETFSHSLVDGGILLSRQIAAANLKEAIVAFVASARLEDTTSVPDRVLTGPLVVWSWIADDYDVIDTSRPADITDDLRQKPVWSTAAAADYVDRTPKCGLGLFLGGVGVAELCHFRTSIVAWITMRALCHLEELGIVTQSTPMWWTPVALSGHERLALHLPAKLDALQQRDTAIRGALDR